MKSERLYLRNFKADDLDDFYEYAKGENVGPNAGWEPHKNISVSSQILDSFIKDEGEFAIVFKETNKVIGSVGFHKDTKRSVQNAYMIGYCLSEDYWGKGIMTEAVKLIIEYAFEQCNVSVLSVYHFPFNDRSKNVILKCGFVHEGKLRQSFTSYNGGVVYDEICYSMLKEEYLLRKLADSITLAKEN